MVWESRAAGEAACVELRRAAVCLALPHMVKARACDAGGGAVVVYDDAAQCGPLHEGNGWMGCSNDRLRLCLPHQSGWPDFVLSLPQSVLRSGSACAVFSS